jgi:sulfate transport system substrate-binding protein
MRNRLFAIGVAAALSMAGWLSGSARADTTILNVSYDPTREFYADVNKVFAAQWLKDNGETVSIRTSHGGSGAQARAVIDGLEADVVTLALAGDIDKIAKKTGLIADDWQSRLPFNSTPYTSTVVFLVRAGNPKSIHDWADLVKPGVQVVTPNPKTSGGARWNFLAAWAYALKQNKNEETAAKDFITRLYANVPVLDTGSRGSTITFVERHQGDVLIGGENEALLAQQEAKAEGFQIVVPSTSILIEPSVSLVDGNVDKHGTRKVAEAYLNFLYTPQGQELAAKHFFRPRNAVVLGEYLHQFPSVDTSTSIADFGGWGVAQQKFFSDGGIFDQIYKPVQ